MTSSTPKARLVEFLRQFGIVAAERPNHRTEIYRVAADLTVDTAVLDASDVQEILDENRRLTVAAEASSLVMRMLAEHGESIVSRLMDTDDNAGERLREALRAVGQKV